MKHAKKIGAGGSALALACAFIMPWEGLWTTAKIDTIGTGRPPTVCYGETEGVKVGDRYTKQECEEKLAKKLPRYAAEIAPCIKVPVSDKTRAAFISFAYNVGSAGACRSSAFARLNAGDSRGACDALMQWTKAQGRVVKGLVNRRTAERKLCLEGINEPVSSPIEKPAEKPTFWQRVKLLFQTIMKG
jgi:lysozyme